MIENSKILRPVSLAEYNDEYLNLEDRVTASKISTINFAVAYTTNEALIEQDTALKFIVKMVRLGNEAMRLIPCKSDTDTFELLDSSAREVVTYIEPAFRESGLIAWTIEKGWPFHVKDTAPPRVQKFRDGFFSHVRDDSIPHIPNLPPGQGF